MRDNFVLADLTEKQKIKLCKFYKVSSVDELTICENGDIVIKKTGGKGTALKLYLQDHNGKNHELSISTFIGKQPNLGYSNISKSEAEAMLSDFIPKIIPKDAELHQLYVEGKDPQTLLFQQLIIFYSDKLKKVLCGNEINKKFIGASGNPGYSDLDIYNLLKTDDGCVIKGFAFCTKPTKGELYIDVICGTGGTGELVRNLYKRLDTLGCKYISLDAIETPQALAFYHKLGFKKSDSDTTKTLEAISKSRAKTFKDFCKAAPSKAGGKLYLGNIPKKIRAKYIYNPECWFDAIKKGDVPTMDGSGLGSFFSGAWNKVKSIASKFSPNVSDFTNQCKAILAKYGQGTVVKLIIIRQPIMGVLDKFINAITFGSFEAAKKKYGYDKLFHLQLAAYVKVGRGTTKIVLEKNETVDMSVSTEHVQTGEKEFKIVDIPEAFTLNDLVMDARQMQGDQKFFEYDAFKNNCQWFISYLLHGQGLYGAEEKAFLYQDMTEFNKDLPKWLPGFARKVTDLGATVANLRGKAKRDFSRVRKPVENVVQTGKATSPLAQKVIDDMKAREDARVKANLDRIQRRQDASTESVRKELEGGIGVQRYITPEEHAANRDAAIDAAKANKSRGVTYMNPRIAEQQRKDKEAADALFERQQAETKARRGKKTIQDYQAEERYRKQHETEQKREDDQIAANTATYRSYLTEKKQNEATAAEEARAAVLVEEGRKRLQRVLDLEAYADGRIDDIKDAATRSRAQYERMNAQNNETLRKAAEESRSGFDRWYNNFLADNAIKLTRKIPKVGDFVADVTQAYADEEDKNGDFYERQARRLESGIVDHGPVFQDDYTGNGKATNTKLYNSVKKKIYAKNPKHSLFRSAAIAKEYKNRGGEYIDDGNESGMNKWFGDKWISANDYYHDGTTVPCGSSNTEEKFDEYPLCRPSKIIKQMSDSQLKKMIASKTGPAPVRSAKVLRTKKFNT